MLLIVGASCLGYVAFTWVDAEAYQAYAGRTLDQEVALAPTPVGSRPESARPAEVDRVILPPGSALGRLEIKRLGLRVVILEGTDDRTLRRGVGHVIGTAFPGEAGNIALAGHRDTFFRALRNVRPGDEITLVTRTGTHRYRVETIQVLTPRDIDVLGGTSGSMLTLVTCHPFNFIGSAPNRFIVRAHRLNEHPPQ
jgi:sortase A